MRIINKTDKIARIPMMADPDHVYRFVPGEESSILTRSFTEDVYYMQKCRELGLEVVGVLNPIATVPYTPPKAPPPPDPSKLADGPVPPEVLDESSDTDVKGLDLTTGYDEDLGAVAEESMAPEVLGDDGTEDPLIAEEPIPVKKGRFGRPIK